jgi:hypothetical protein
MTKAARERSFDELGSGLASGEVSRREALKWLGAALLGGVLAFRPEAAEARFCDPGLRRCGNTCYDPNTRFCCHGHGGVNECDTETQYCCIGAEGVACRDIREIPFNVPSFCLRIKAPGLGRVPAEH